MQLLDDTDNSNSDVYCLFKLHNFNFMPLRMIFNDNLCLHLTNSKLVTTQPCIDYHMIDDIRHRYHEAQLLHFYPLFYYPQRIYVSNSNEDQLLCLSLMKNKKDYLLISNHCKFNYFAQSQLFVFSFDYLSNNNYYNASLCSSKYPNLCLTNINNNILPRNCSKYQSCKYSFAQTKIFN